MRALTFEAGKARLVEAAEPRTRPGWAKVQVLLSGICNTDLELLRGYCVKALISEEFPLDRAPAALREAARSGVLKVLLRPQSSESEVHQP